MAHRNLGWGYRYHSGDFDKAIAAYEKAISLETNEAIFYSELDALYEMTNAPIEKRLALFEKGSDVVKRRDDAFVRQVTVLTLAGKAETAAEYLSGINFSYREGNSRAREVIIDAHLIAGRNLYEKGDYKKALEYFLKAQIPDEEAGSARSGNRDIQVNYHIGLAYEALGNKTKAKQYYRTATETSIRRVGNMSYYQGLGYAKLGNAVKAKEVFEAMVSEGDKQLQGSGSRTDAFAIFAEREVENIRKSNSYTLRGLGYKGLGQVDKANEDLSRAADLSHGNLWAKAEFTAINKNK
jgi:tetratricopeptide (TPR) repeat protein